MTKPDPGVPPRGLELVAKWEQLRLEYDGAARAGEADSKSNLDGKIKVDALSLGANYWWTRHLRLTVNYVLNRMPDSTAGGSPDQRAMAPGNLVAAGVNDDARTSAHTLHEVSARVGVMF